MKEEAQVQLDPEVEHKRERGRENRREEERATWRLRRTWHPGQTGSYDKSMFGSCHRQRE